MSKLLRQIVLSYKCNDRRVPQPIVIDIAIGQARVELHILKIIKVDLCIRSFLNQVCAGLWLARGWFLKIDPVWIVGMCVCVCPRPRLLISSGMLWSGINLIQLVKQVLQLLYGNCSYH